MSFEQDNSERSGQVRAGIACSQPKSSARFQRDKSKKQKSNISKRFPKLRDFGEKRKEKKKGTEEEEESRNAFDIFPACAYKSTRQVNFYVSVRTSRSICGYSVEIRKSRPHMVKKHS
ncbi:hypothetical protein TWF225_006376 [Orbilia oligospora]|nr:hypothetical protein TWF225_006376 [Orbilia oligospora]KAF3258459.1 hypothetical protein TWF128_004704 [Orbilia oligospora]KAF3282118.1 hypothetical protein TWF132_010819 [Orbilia oligospora]